MVEETAIRVQINAAKLAGQGIFGILKTVASMLQARQYGQQSIQSLNRQSQALASVELNDKTLPYVRRQLKEYSVDFAITKDKDTGQLNLWTASRPPLKTALQRAARNVPPVCCRSCPNGLCSARRS